MLLSLIVTVVSSTKGIKLIGYSRMEGSLYTHGIPVVSKTLPWETPFVMLLNVEFTPFKETYCFRSDE